MAVDHHIDAVDPEHHLVKCIRDPDAPRPMPRLGVIAGVAETGAASNKPAKVAGSKTGPNAQRGPGMGNHSRADESFDLSPGHTVNLGGDFWQGFGDART